ncbi:hypothetical protein BX661DRAFT_173186 [Kickxella alabastrina]|uniref:uncharacterized protein n=1 Tax=Kickxella alabastrina TaxID=61397 RepID=UPI0022201DB9|nr:uncharacterized protein BX661DRAFT_173186 [Kickxella alabastrina]KAI7821781.1 hypothetical protein BX661DRAFT_173186 [Kickxella alabastrina]
MRIQAYTLWSGGVYQGVIIVSPDLILHGTTNALLIGMLRLRIVKRVFIDIHFHIIRLLNNNPLKKFQGKHGHQHKINFKQKTVKEASRYLVSKDSCAMSEDKLHTWYKDRLQQVDFPVPGIKVIHNAYYSWISVNAITGLVQQLSHNGAELKSYIRVILTEFTDAELKSTWAYITSDLPLSPDG